MQTRKILFLTLSVLILFGCQLQEATPNPGTTISPTDILKPPLTTTSEPPTPTPTTIPTPTQPQVETPPGAWQDTSVDWGELTCGDYLLINNVWGKGDLTGYTQSVGVSDDMNACRFRWDWDWPRSAAGSVRAYPEIIYGWKPWSAASTTPSLPIQLTVIQDLTVRLDFTTQMSGEFNSAFDLWLTSTNPPSGDTITREVMIWVGKAEMSPGGSKVASLEIDGVPYSLFKAQWDWTYLAFIQETDEPTASIPIASLLRYLVDNQYVLPEEYLASIEFGNEIVYGSGQTQVDEFIVQIK
jgi:hypothetical protein